MGKVLVGERNLEHRNVLKKVFGQVDPALVIDFAGNGEDMLDYLAEQAPQGEPMLIVLDPTLPAAFSGSLVRVIKADGRFSKIPIVILTEKDGADYVALRGSGVVELSLLKPSQMNGWELLARRIIELAEKARH